MKVYNILKQLKDPCVPIHIYGKNGTLIFRNVLNNVPWHIARCDAIDTWIGSNDIIYIKIKD